eukprot:TRINITY_DN715_c0_g1_i28.p1 TRINITY_DN715_c0_g1~~TRINITY_DN715_c0_g1_i28.p1  ORF type:complete len:283 (-),score=41.25 TRINITY_DN715_c0_g1_i28:43-891(-)
MNLNLAKDDPAYKQLHILLKEKLSERMDSVDDSLPTYILHIAVAMNKSKPEVVSALDFVQPEIAKTIVDWMWNNFKEYAKLQSAKEEEGGSLAGKRSKRSSKEATVKKKLEADKKDSTVIDKNVKRRSVLKKGKECNGSLDIEGGKEEKHKIESTTASPLVRPSVSFRVVPKRKPPAESKEEDALPTTQPNPDTKVLSTPALANPVQVLAQLRERQDLSLLPPSRDVQEVPRVRVWGQVPVHTPADPVQIWSVLRAPRLRLSSSCAASYCVPDALLACLCLQ